MLINLPLDYYRFFKGAIKISNIFVSLISVLCSLPLVDPVERANIEHDIYSKINEKYEAEKTAHSWIFMQCGRRNNGRISQAIGNF